MIRRVTTSVSLLLTVVLVGCNMGSDATEDPLFDEAYDIYKAAAAGDAPAVKEFMQMGSWDPFVPNYEGILPLCAAAKGGNVEIIKLMVQEGADVNQADQNGITPLQYAQEAEHPEAVALLKSLGAR